MAKPKTNWSNIISFLALVLAALSLWYTVYVNREEKKEFLNLNAVSVKDGYKVEIDSSILNFTKIHLLWECILTNNSNHTISIVSYEIIPKSVENGIWYSDLNQGLSSDKGTLLTPFSVQPGESLRFYPKVAVLINAKAFVSLKKHAPRGQPLSPRLIQYYIAKDSIDIFGNRITPAFYDGQTLTLTLGKNLEQNSYELSLTTGRKNNVTTELSWYPKFVLRESRN